MSNPFTPPSARVADGGREKGSPVKAVILGLLTDVGGSIVFGLLLAIAYGVHLGASGATPEQVAAAMGDVGADSWLSIVGMVVGTMFSGLGGYVCARVAKQSEFALGALVAVLSIVLSMLMSAEHYPLALNLVFAVASFIATMFGVRLGVARNASA